MYVVERWLARMSGSPCANDFILNGGMLLAALGNRRPTQDADTLARNMRADEAALAARVVEIAAIDDADDGVEFLPDTVRTRSIRNDALYAGVRVTMDARLGTARLKLKLDVIFGDPVTPVPQIVELPSLRPGTPPVRLLGYPLATTMAEKIVSAIELRDTSTRVRDWADLYTLLTSHEVDRDELIAAITATAAFRGATLLPLSVAIGDLVGQRSSAWVAYRRGLGPDGEHLPQAFGVVVDTVTSFVDPLLPPP